MESWMWDVFEALKVNIYHEKNNFLKLRFALKLCPNPKTKLRIFSKKKKKKGQS